MLEEERTNIQTPNDTGLPICPTLTLGTGWHFDLDWKIHGASVGSPILTRKIDKHFDGLEVLSVGRIVHSARVWSTTCEGYQG